MKNLLLSMFLLGVSGVAYAVDEYNDVPAGDKQYAQCLAYADKLGWQGGDEKSPIKGQTKLEAFCTCMWNETPDDFKGNLATFADSEKGAKTNHTCEKYSNWHD
jgi:hypothetical protein